jgi:replicative DNA helicase
MSEQEKDEHRLLELMCSHAVRMRRYVGDIRPELFSPMYRSLCEVILTISPQDMDPVILRNRMSRFYNPGSSELLFNSTLPFNVAVVEQLIGNLYDAHARRQAMTVGYELINQAKNCENPLAVLESARHDLRPVLPGSRSRGTDELFREMLSLDMEAQFIRTYVRSLDAEIEGAEKTDLVILAGAASMGKTALAVLIFEQNIMAGVPGGYFSLEMSDTALVTRMTSRRMRISSKLIRSRKLDDAQKARVHEYRELLKSKRYFIDPKSRKLSHIANVMRARASEGYRFFVVDYLQLCVTESKNLREQEVAFITRTLKELAQELETPIFALSQLSREPNKRMDPRPKMSDLRESGAIEQDADFVLFPFRPSYYAASGEQMVTEQMEIIIGKGRSTGTGKVFATWDGTYGDIT